MAQILVIDDDASVCSALNRCISRMGHTASYALTLADGRSQLAGFAADVLFLDVRLPDGNGLDDLPVLRQECPGAEVIIITGDADGRDAEMAIRAGAWDYLRKPLALSEIELQLRQVLQYRQERAARQTAIALKRDNLVGDSPRMHTCLDLLVQAATSDVAVLVTGETGTGKEVFCRAIHENSARSLRPFVVVDCAALPETLVESVLFGHVKGAFTGADRAQPGLVKQANGGTLFLDEIGELPLSMQRAFLRVLQEHRFRPVGGHEEETSDFRLLAATNRDLSVMAADGHFRSDLLFRIQAHRIELPPLRERREDIRALVTHHIARISARRGMAPRQVSDSFMEALENADWPGNVRELLGAVEAAVAAAGGCDTLFLKHLPVELRLARARQAANDHTGASPHAEESAAPASSPLSTFRDHMGAALDESERRYLERLIAVADGDLTKACQISQLSRSRVYQLLSKHTMSLTK